MRGLFSEYEGHVLKEDLKEDNDYSGELYLRRIYKELE